MPMKNPPHPGLTIKHDCIEPLGLTVGATAEALGVSRKQLSAVINGHARVSAPMALRLAAAFGGSAQVWLHMQANYDLARALLTPPRSVKQLAPEPA
jgi:addiction module HigA family antidote